MPSSPGPGRVLIATGSGPLVWEPSWTRYDVLGTSCRCEGFDCSTGRQSELDTTDTGRATVYFNDRNGTLNDNSLVGCQVMLQLYDPVAAAWHPRWRGHIDDIVRDTDPYAEFSRTRLECVGIFDYLGGVGFVPGEMGDVAPAGMDGVVFYEDGPAGSGMVIGRAEKILDDAGLESDAYVVFSLNVDVNETLYDSDDVLLQGLRDCVDADFPGLANVFEDRFGRVAIHGLQSRFDPDGVSAGAGDEAWDYQEWDAATAPNVSTGVAQIREFSFNRPRSRIINSYVAWPRADENGVAIDRAEIVNQVRTNPTSIAALGWHSRDATDLIVKESNISADTGLEWCQKIAEFYVNNYHEIRENLQRVTLMALRPDDPRAAATWDMMCRMDISDSINVNVAEEGINELYFIEGVNVSCRFGNPGYDIVTVTPNLTPASYYGDNPFEEA